MDLGPYAANVHRDLVAAAELGGEDARKLAGHLATALDSTLRLALLEALSAATDEISQALAPGSVELVLRERVASFSVTRPPTVVPAEDFTTSIATTVDGPALRINLRIPENLKLRVEEAAKQEGLSVNAWLVRAAAATLDRGAESSRRKRTKSDSGADHVTGWMR
ncbi:toxin-antitoxin system HicB family antitoxin [Fodinicola feengrottensis]|uniref:Toxin-antitoxin system HicB family antitoxin n=1 Tax=Fodinicola feengrottensis TaxID=435914 RepID=A0ABN2G243_9ACTN|nr:toxin-antitoxin system HicB family antitoxin [Fodinicola feengrottensis]